MPYFKFSEFVKNKILLFSLNEENTLQFCYNRPDKTKIFWEKLKKSDYKNYKYYFFCDGPKYKEDIKKCDEVLKIVKNLKLNLNV